MTQLNISLLQKHDTKKFKMLAPIFVFQHIFLFNTTCIQVFVPKLQCFFHYPTPPFGSVFLNVTVWKYFTTGLGCIFHRPS